MLDAVAVLCCLVFVVFKVLAPCTLPFCIDRCFPIADMCYYRDRTRIYHLCIYYNVPVISHLLPWHAASARRKKPVMSLQWPLAQGHCGMIVRRIGGVLMISCIQPGTLRVASAVTVARTRVAPRAPSYLGLWHRGNGISFLFARDVCYGATLGVHQSISSFSRVSMYD